MSKPSSLVDQVSEPNLQVGNGGQFWQGGRLFNSGDALKLLSEIVLFQLSDLIFFDQNPAAKSTQQNQSSAN